METQPAATRVLHEHANYTVIDSIYHRINIRDVLAVCSTSRRGWECWKFYRGRMFSMNKLVFTYVDDTKAFQRTLHETGSVMFGKTVQLFMDREDIGGRPLEIMAEMSKAPIIEQFLLEVAGYTRWKGDFKKLQEYITRKRFSRRGWDTPKVPACVAQRIEHPIRAFFTFHRTSTKHGLQYIRLGLCTTCISKSIITAGESERHALNICTKLTSKWPACDFAYISSRSAVSLYPRTTLIRKVNVHLESLIYPSAHLSPDKYDHLTNHLEQVYGYTRWLGSELGIYKKKNSERSIGDRKCWSIHYNEDGETLSGDEAMGQVEQDELRSCNKWKLEVHKGGVCVKVSHIRRDTFWP